jgi:diguanylate cyclase (GGDEF)-like protein
MIAAAPFLGWYILGFFALSAVNLQTLDWRLGRARRPELVIAGSLLWTALVIGGAVATTGGAISPLLPWMVVPCALAASRFRPTVIIAGASVTVLIMVGVTFGVDPSGALHHPVLLIASVALLVNVGASVWAVTSAEIEHRAVATIDPLTGLLNRKALGPRFAELATQALISDSSVVVIVCDLDHFKAINDTHGHERGDRVLCDTASTMRTALRTFELIYRYGGEEFVIVLPGASLSEGRLVAERVRIAVAAGRPGGLDVTLSAGVSGATGAAVELKTLFAAADHALYDAKRAGRNRIATAGLIPVATPQPAAA